MTNIQIVAEIGINHNGSVDTAKKLMLIAKAAGCDYVKFQKRTPSICVPEDQKNVIKQTPWGEMTYLEYKRRIEFHFDEYTELFAYAKQLGIGMFASVWDIHSADFMRQFTQIVKIPSALITNKELLIHTREIFDYVLISTGMSTEDEILEAYKLANPEVVMHTNSSYPAPVKELNLQYITRLAKLFPTAHIGYSGHEYGITTTFAAVALGATWIERHITLDHNMWGSDHLSSIEPNGLFKLVKGIRDIEQAMRYEPIERILFDGELNKRKTLRGI
jgi:N-acetylneuraminate synthase